MKIPLKFLFVTAFLFLFLKISAAQSSDLYLLELNNGITVRCYLKEYTEDKQLKVISEDGKEITVKLEEVKKFERIDGITYKKNETMMNYGEYKSSILKKNKFSNTVKMGPMRNGKNDKFYFSISDIANYELGEVSIGAGISYDAIPDNAFIPIFADLKYNIETRSNIVPFLFLDAGYSMTTDLGSGEMFAVGIGIKSNISPTVNFIADFGYKYQALKFTETFLGYSFKFSGNTNYITANAGIQF